MFLLLKLTFVQAAGENSTRGQGTADGGSPSLQNVTQEKLGGKENSWAERLTFIPGFAKRFVQAIKRYRFVRGFFSRTEIIQIHWQFFSEVRG